MKNGKAKDKIAEQPQETALTVRPDETAILNALAELGVSYDEDIDSQREGVTTTFPAVKSLKEYECFVYEYGADTEGNPNRIKMKNFVGQVVFDHALRALFYQPEHGQFIWRRFPNLVPKEILANQDSNMPLCSAIMGKPNREFAFYVSCDRCLLNVMGSPCKPKHRLFVWINSEAENGQKLQAEMVTFTMPTASLKWWNGRKGYLNELAGYKSKQLPKGLPYYTVWTEFTRELVHKVLESRDEMTGTTSKRPVDFHEVHFRILKNAGGSLAFCTKDEIKVARQLREEMQKVALRVQVTDYAGPDPHAANGSAVPEDDTPADPFGDPSARATDNPFGDQ